MTQWCILRCSGQNTIPLVRSLSKAGFDVWAPVEQVTRRIPRANVKRRIDVAMLPSYVFVRAHHLPAILAIANDPVSDHREFRVFRHLGGFPLIADDTLAPLRLMERRLKPKEAAPTLAPGDRVRLTDGGFAGLSGVVESHRGQFAMVTLPGFASPLKIASFYLLPPEDECDNQRAA